MSYLLEHSKKSQANPWNCIAYQIITLNHNFQGAFEEVMPMQKAQ